MVRPVVWLAIFDHQEGGAASRHVDHSTWILCPYLVFEHENRVRSAVEPAFLCIIFLGFESNHCGLLGVATVNVRVYLSFSGNAWKRLDLDTL